MPDALTFTLNIDWDGDGNFDDGNEAPYLDALTISRGRSYLIRKDGLGFERLDIGTLNGSLVNTDGRYNVEDTGSPYYPYIPTGKLMQLKVETPSTLLWDLFAGTVNDIVPDSKPASQAIITGEDGVRLLKQDASVTVQTNVRIDQAIPLLLAKIGYPWNTDLEVGADVRNYWWLDRGDVLNAIADLADSELGSVWLAANGDLRFRSRYSLNPIAASLTTDHFLLGSIETPRPWDVVRNAVRINVYPPVLETAVEVWRWQEQPYFAPGASRSVWANFTFNGVGVPVVNPILPVAATDYTFNTQTNGSGTNLTANFSVVIEDIFSGAAKLLITNNGGTGGYPTLMRMRANAITVPNQTFVESQDATSISRYQRRTFEMALRWFQNSKLAQDIADFMCTFLASPRLFVRGVLNNQPDLQFGIDLGDVVNLYIPEKGIDGIYRLAWVSHKSTDKGLRVFDSEMLFEPFPDLSGNYWQFPAEIGVTTTYAP